MTDVDPTLVLEADVYKGDVPAGTLTRDGDDVVFRYLPDYVDSGLPGVATTIPVSAREIRTRGGAVPPFFAGLLPEGRRLQALQRTLKTSPDDEFSQLLAVGRDCIGDVRVLPTGSDPRADPQIPSVSRLEDVVFADLFERSINQGASNRDAAVPGAQDKLSDAMLSLPVKQARRAAILKLTPRDYPRLVENEAFFLDAARAAGISVAPFTVIRDKVGASGLLVERFDRRTRKHSVDRIAQEDATQLAGRWPSAKGRMTVREVFDAVTSVTPARPVAAANLLRQFVFSYLIFNGDLHAKNVSVYNHPDGIWSVTPAYDLVSTLPYGDDRMTLHLDGRDRHVTGEMFVGLGERYDVPASVGRKIIDTAAQAVDELSHSLEDIGFDERKTAHLRRGIAERILEVARA